jgi:long-chain acyl-CoA synthetase
MNHSTSKLFAEKWLIISLHTDNTSCSFYSFYRFLTLFQRACMIIDERTPLVGFLDYFYQFEAEKPKAIFMRQPEGDTWHDISWENAGNQARRMAQAMKNLGLQAGDKVGIVSKNCYHWIIADLAIAMGGFVSTPFYPNLTGQQLKEVLIASDAKLCFVGKLDEWDQMKTGLTEDLQIIRFPQYPGNAIVKEGLAWNELLAKTEPLSGNPSPGLDDLWTVIFTSGTTGAPKGVMLSHRHPAALLYNEKVNGDLKIFEGNEHRFFSFLPLNHIAERVIVEIACLLTGGTISFAESIDSFAKNLQNTQPTLFMAVPRIWSKFYLGILARMPEKRLNFLLKLPFVGNLLRNKIKQGLGLSQARIMLTGAAPTPEAVKQFFLKIGLKLQEVYAMTENTGGCTLMPSDQLKPGGVVGKPLPNVQIKIDQETGEVCMKAPWVMLGYYNDADKTAQVLRDGWLHTGDQGEMTADGFLKLTGRVSDTFKSAKGKYIVPAPIEMGFSQNTFIEQVCVVGLAQPQPLALAVLSEVGKLAEKEEVESALSQTLREINQGLSNYEKVSAVVLTKEPWLVENGILTPTLKIRRDVLHRKYEAKYEQWAELKSAVIWE